MELDLSSLWSWTIPLWGLFLIVLFLAGVLAEGVVLVVRDGLFRKLFQYVKSVHIQTYIVQGILLVAGGLAINVSYQYLPIMVINILIISSQLLSVLLGFMFFKERLSLKQWIGLVLIMISFFVVATAV